MMWKHWFTPTQLESPASQGGGRNLRRLLTWTGASNSSQVSWVKHFENRLAVMEEKAMIAVMRRRIAGRPRGKILRTRRLCFFERAAFSDHPGMCDRSSL